jgi:hypothetical protein
MKKYFQHLPLHILILSSSAWLLFTMQSIAFEGVTHRALNGKCAAINTFVH